MTDDFDAANLHRRLRKILGQVAAVEKMIDEDVPCEDVLMQINAAKNALHKVGQLVLEQRLRECVAAGVASGDVQQTMEGCVKALDRFSHLG